MIFFLYEYKDTSPKTIMHMCGYNPHPKKNGYVRDEPTGRFHAFVKTKPYRLDIHYDILIDNKHCSGFDLPRLHNEERKRIEKSLRKLRIATMTKNKRDKLFDKVFM